jgi:hypothetical protein
MKLCSHAGIGDFFALRGGEIAPKIGNCALGLIYRCARGAFMPHGHERDGRDPN